MKLRVNSVQYKHAIMQFTSVHFPIPPPKKITIPKAKILYLVSMAVKCVISLLGENKCSRTNYMKYTYMGLHNAEKQKNPHQEIFMA